MASSRPCTAPRVKTVTWPSGSTTPCIPPSVWARSAATWPAWVRQGLRSQRLQRALRLIPASELRQVRSAEYMRPRKEQIRHFRVHSCPFVAAPLVTQLSTFNIPPPHHRFGAYALERRPV